MLHQMVQEHPDSLVSIATYQKPWQNLCSAFLPPVVIILPACFKSYTSGSGVAATLQHWPAQPVAREQNVARGDISNEKTSVNVFFGTAETQRRSNSEQSLAVYLRRHALHY